MNGIIFNSHCYTSFSLFHFWVSLFAWKWRKPIFATFVATFATFNVSFKNVGKYHHCLISNGSGTEKPSFWRNCRRNKRKGKKLLHDMIMLSVLWFIMAEKITSLWLPSAGSTIHQETNEGDMLEGCIWHEGRLQGTQEAVSRQKCGWELIWNARCSEKGEKLGENA